MARAPEAPPPTTPRPRAASGTPLYLHTPFCATKCFYCDFFSVKAEGEDRGSNLSALKHEIELHAPALPRTVFVGGGTPSLLSIEELTALFETLERVTHFRASASEVTIECNPESLSRDKAAVLLDLGVTRFSIGFQSLRDDVLKLFGRVHDVAQSFRAYESVRAAGARNVNVDLIFAIPGQEPVAWGADLERVLDLEPDHLSAYNLTFEEDTVFRRWLEIGRIAKEPEESELALFELTRATLQRRSYEAYEISNFARAGRRCEHNVTYWKNGEYLGLGPSAVSKIGNERFGNVRSLAGYARQMHAAGDARAWQESPGARERLLETWWLGLRLSEGMNAAQARARAGFEESTDPALPIATRLVEQGVLDEQGGTFRLNRRGLPLADWVAKQFLHS